jgi:predicted alpha/beta-fold hydrolase
MTHPQSTFPAFRPPWWLAGGHRQTLWTTAARPVPEVAYEREVLELSDGDFLDLAWAWAAGGADHPAPSARPTAPGDSSPTATKVPAPSAAPSPALPPPHIPTPARHLAILSHGLEGNVDRRYMRGMAQRFNAAGWDVLAWNMRGCGERSNRLPRPYHSGATEDLHAVVTHGLARGGYDTVVLVGFSLGANLTLLYLGREREIVPAAVAGAVAFSTPVDLLAAARNIERPANWLYEQRFLRSLHRRARALARRHPDALDPAVLRRATTIFAYDDHITAPLAGFAGALDYYARSSSLTRLAEIDRPTLLVSAADDPFLPAACYPRGLVDPLPHVTLEIPDRGGHVGFLARGDGDGRARGYWSERRAVAFAREIVG